MFFEGLQVKEFERLIDRTSKIEQGIPIGVEANMPKK